MVIHDMRNPTTSIEYALKEVLHLLLMDKQKPLYSKEIQSPNQIRSNYNSINIEESEREMSSEKKRKKSVLLKRSSIPKNNNLESY